MAREISGVVVIDKPSGPTSFDVVRRVKGLFKVRRCGHTGTLDPIATGVLPICLGEATKIASFVSDGEKEYDAVVRFGAITDTQDAAGRTVETRPLEGLSEAAVKDALAGFVGLLEQTPPMYSARKVDGKRLYELARAGEEVEREARQVHIDEARLVFFRPPDAGIFVRCSKGTYLRTLAHDLGQKLGPGAHLRGLKRVRVGPFGLEDSVALDTLMSAAREGPEVLDRHVWPLARGLAELAELQLDLPLARRVAHGHPPGPADLSRLRAAPLPRGRKVRLLDPEGRVLAVAESDGVGTLKLLRVLVGGAHDLVEKEY
jgi:tRNA pseudouridine55 synthase